MKCSTNSRKVASDQYRAPRVPLAANLTGQLMTEALKTARYWRDHLRNAVQFAAGMTHYDGGHVHSWKSVESAGLPGLGYAGAGGAERLAPLKAGRPGRPSR